MFCTDCKQFEQAFVTGCSNFKVESKRAKRAEFLRAPWEDDFYENENDQCTAELEVKAHEELLAVL